MARGRTRRWFERVALGAIMGVVAFVVERRLVKMMRGRGESEPEEPAEARLAVSPEQIDE